MEIGPKATKNAKNGPSNHENVNFRESWFLPMDIRIQTQEPLEKEAWKQALQKAHLLLQSDQKTWKMGPRNLQENSKNLSLDLEVSFLVLPYDPGSPQDPPAHHREATKHAK